MTGIGDKIRIKRVTKGLSQEYMGWTLGISQAAYSKLERDETEISVMRVYEIAEIFEISAFELMPKPKYGSGLNAKFIYNTLYKLRKIWTGGVKKRIATADHSDIQKFENR